MMDRAPSIKQAALLLAVSLPFLLGHGGGCGCGGDEDAEVLGPPTGTECPDGSALSYDDFGQPFFETYCLRCHSVDVTGADREGAPSDHNFDTQFEAQALADHIDRVAGSGPATTNTAMPPTSPTPTMEERQMLSEWLACGAP